MDDDDGGMLERPLKPLSDENLWRVCQATSVLILEELGIKVDELTQPAAEGIAMVDPLQDLHRVQGCALGLLYRRLFREVCRVIMSLGSNIETAEDVVQETLTDILIERPTLYDLRRGMLCSYVIVCAKNRYYSLFRSPKAISLEEIEVNENELQVFNDFDERTIRELVIEQLLQYPYWTSLERQLLGYWMDGYKTPKEIAPLIKVSAAEISRIAYDIRKKAKGLQ